MAKWLMYSKRADFTAMGKKYQIDPVVARILVNRDLTEDAAITAFLHPSEKDLGDGKALKDMDVAVALLQKARKKRSVSLAIMILMGSRRLIFCIRDCCVWGRS